MTKSTTIVFYLKINFIIIAITIVNIAVNKFNFVMMNMRFISTAINTHYTTSKFKKIKKYWKWKINVRLKISTKIVFIKNLIHIKSRRIEIYYFTITIAQFFETRISVLIKKYLSFLSWFLSWSFFVVKKFLLLKFCLRLSVNFHLIFIYLFIMMRKSLSVVNDLSINIFFWNSTLKAF